MAIPLNKTTGQALNKIFKDFKKEIMPNKIELDEEALKLAESIKDRFKDVPEARLNIARGIFLFADHLNSLQTKSIGEKVLKEYSKTFDDLAEDKEHKNGCLLFHGDAECSCKPPQEKCEHVRCCMHNPPDVDEPCKEKHPCLKCGKDAPHQEGLEDWEKEFDKLWVRIYPNNNNDDDDLEFTKVMQGIYDQIQQKEKLEIKSFIKSLLLKEKQLWKDNLCEKIKKVPDYMSCNIHVVGEEHKDVLYFKKEDIIKLIKE